MDYDYIICANDSNDITALYLAYKLLKHDSSFKVALATESTECSIEDEYQVTRYDPDLHKNLATLLKELHLEQTPFHHYSSPFLAPNYNTLTLEEIQCIEKNKDIAPCFALLKYAANKILQDQWDIENDSLKDPFRNARKLWIKTHAKYKNQYLYNLGIWNILAFELSKPALEYIIQYGTFYHAISSNPNAADTLLYILDILVTLRIQYSSFNIQGSFELTKTLAHKVGGGIKDQVVTFLKVSDKTIVSLRNEIVTCKELLFTCNRSKLLKINGFDNNTYTLIQTAMFDMTVIKITIKIENPPWNSSTCPYSNYGAHKIPCRELFYHYEELNNTGIMILYADSPFCNYWKTIPLQQIKEHVHEYVRSIFIGYNNFSVIDVALNTCSSIRMWNPGYSSDSSKTLLQANICSNTGNIEDSIINANQLVAYLLGPPTSTGAS